MSHWRVMITFDAADKAHADVAVGLIFDALIDGHDDGWMGAIGPFLDEDPGEDDHR